MARLRSRLHQLRLRCRHRQRNLSRMADKTRFIEALQDSGRDGIDDLIEYLETETDFFTAPASTQYHGAVPGGLVAHSLAVMDAVVEPLISTCTVQSADVQSALSVFRNAKDSMKDAGRRSR